MLLYVPPINPVVRDDPDSMRVLGDLMALLKRSAEVNAPGGRVRVVTDTLLEQPAPLVYRDIYHLTNGQGVIRRVVGLLEEQLGQTFVKMPEDKTVRP